MCTQRPLFISISSDQLSVPVKLKQAKAYVNKYGYEFILEDKHNVTIMPFKSQSAAERVKEHVLDILNDMCENLNSSGVGCSSMYRCCDCGDHSCGCAYCWSCNACDVCLSVDVE